MPRIGLFTTGLLILIAGCAARQGEALTEAPRPTRAAPSPDEATPVAPTVSIRERLRDLAARAAALPAYTATLVRQERRGLPLFERLTPPERIGCWFRRTPFSVRLLWLDPDVKYGESTFIAGRDDGQVRFRARRGLLGFPPATVRVRPQTPVTWGETKQPVTEFGLERMMVRTLASLEAAGDAASVVDEGIHPAPVLGRPVRRLRIEYPPGFSRTPVQELYMDDARRLPLGVSLFLPSGELDAMYLYDQVNPDVALTDDDFLLESERAAIHAAAP